MLKQNVAQEIRSGRGARDTSVPTPLLYCTVLYSTLLYSTVLYSTLLSSSLLYSTLHYPTLLCFLNIDLFYF